MTAGRNLSGHPKRREFLKRAGMLSFANVLQIINLMREHEDWRRLCYCSGIAPPILGRSSSICSVGEDMVPEVPFEKKQNRKEMMKIQLRVGYSEQRKAYDCLAFRFQVIQSRSRKPKRALREVTWESQTNACEAGPIAR